MVSSPPSHSPALPQSASLQNLPTPSSPNRFGMALTGLIGRRPRGNTNPRLINGPPSPAEVPPPLPSPGGNQENSGGGGYFPGLRRKASRRLFGSDDRERENANGASGSGGGGSNRSGSMAGNPIVGSNLTTNNTIVAPSNSSSITTRTRRSSSQPPLPQNPDGDLTLRSSTAGPNASNGTRGLHITRSTTLASRELPTLSSTTFNSTPPTAPTSSVTNASNDPTPSIARSSTSTPTPSTRTHIRLVPHLESTRSLHFEPIERAVLPGTVIRIGRFTDRNVPENLSPTNLDSTRIAFPSKVVSRAHAELHFIPSDFDPSGTPVFHIRDTKSSSGTFLNHIRLAGPGLESKLLPLRDGDVIQLGVDYQGGTEEMYRCVKIKVEISRNRKKGPNAFNSTAFKQLRALSSGPQAGNRDLDGIADCCICLYPVTVCQALFIAPCSHTTHFKCIRPLLELHYPGFCCPLCRTFANLDEDVEVEPSLAEEEEEKAEEEKAEEEKAEEERAEEAPATVTSPPVQLPDGETSSAQNETQEDLLLPIPTQDERRSAIVIAGIGGQRAEIPIIGRTRGSRPNSIRFQEPSTASDQTNAGMDQSRTVIPPSMEWREEANGIEATTNGDHITAESSTIEGEANGNHHSHSPAAPIPISTTQTVHSDRENIPRDSEEADQTRFGGVAELEADIERGEGSVSSVEVPEPFQTAATPPNNLSSLSERVITSLSQEIDDDEPDQTEIKQQRQDNSGDKPGGSRIGEPEGTNSSSVLELEKKQRKSSGSSEESSSGSIQSDEGSANTEEGGGSGVMSDIVQSAAEKVKETLEVGSNSSSAEYSTDR